MLSHALLLKRAMPMLESAAAARGEARVGWMSSSARKMQKAIDPAVFGKSDSMPPALVGDTNAGMLGGAPAWKRYGQTKLAMAVLAMSLHERLASRKSKVKMIAVDPGLSASELQVKATQDYTSMKGWEARLVFTIAGQSVEDGSLCQTHACLAPDVPSGSFIAPEWLGLCGLPVSIAEGGVFRKPGGEAPSISTPELKQALMAAVEEAIGGAIV